MLRVEASNLSSARPIPRSRRLHAGAATPRRATSSSRHEILPPRDEATPPQEALSLPQTPARALSNRWSVRLELIEEEVARLYGQGLARGALVWKKGMVEWRPLLSTSELTNLLRKTRITVPESAPQLPAAPRLPTDVALSIDESGRRVPLTVSPIAMDIAPAAAAPLRRRFEVVGAAVAGFALAWLTLGGSTPANPNLQTSVSAAAAAPPALPSPAPSPATPPISSIPLVALTDLPVIGARGAASYSGAVRPARSSQSGGSSGSGPSRADLVGALSRVAGAASGCGERGGAVRVVISFASSGVARSIQVSGKDLPAQTRSCIIGAASRARVPAFDGDPVTVSKTL